MRLARPRALRKRGSARRPSSRASCRTPTGAGGDVERAVGAPHPVAGPRTRIGGLAGLRAFAEQYRGLGYEGMMAIHPSHIPVINEVFSPGPDELARHARLLATAEEAQTNGRDSWKS
ncbi:hypothetical protein AB0H92_32385 [Streptomyces phaeochromogenes]|uniref:hypothetical protein n=1 Tax=Streptomyces phaeochromogenes TaxID=1923 RepID=UPI0033C08D6D